MLGGPYGGLERDGPLIRVSFSSLAVVTVLLPLSGLLACLSISLWYHYDDATYTHCNVMNFLPSLSAALGRVPERYIWRGVIGLHSAPRYLVSAAYFNFYRRRLAKRPAERALSALVLLCSLAENTGLLVLTYVSSTESYGLHKNGFVVFVGSSLLHMLGTCWLWWVIRSHGVHPEEVTSYRWKSRLFLFNVGCCLAAAYFFRRHNEYCETGVYTLFALFEYLMVFSNMAFHLTAFWDFGNKEVMVATAPEDKRY